MVLGHIMTAMPPINAIPAVVAAAPGIATYTDLVPVLPAPEYLLPVSEVIPLQLFAYFMALEHGVDVDRPRNLSKSVVETDK